jgi:hypothetical protein
MTRNASRIIGSILFTSILVSLIACSTQQAFDRDKAAKAIAGSEKFKDCHTGLNNWDACNWAIYTGRWSSVATYWGRPKNTLQSDELKANPVGYWLYKDRGYLQLSSSPEILSLSDAGRTASKEWTMVALPGKEANPVQGPLERWEVPIATKKLVAITNVLLEQRMGVQVAQVSYSWAYSLTLLGVELFKNDKLLTPGRGTEWSTPADITGINLTKTYEDKAVFTFADGGWHLEDDCHRLDIC